MDKDQVTKGDIDALAQMIGRGFQDTATKSDIRDLDQRIEGLEMKLSSYVSRWTEDFSTGQEWLQEHENRLRLLEK